MVYRLLHEFWRTCQSAGAGVKTHLAEDALVKSKTSSKGAKKKGFVFIEM